MNDKWKPWKGRISNGQGPMISSDAERWERGLTALSIGFGNMEVTAILTRAVSVECQKQKSDLR